MLKKLLFVGLLVLVAMMMVGCDDTAKVNMSNAKEVVKEAAENIDTTGIEEWVQEDLSNVQLPTIEVQVELPDFIPNDPAGTVGDAMGFGEVLDTAGVHQTSCSMPMTTLPAGSGQMTWLSAFSQSPSARGRCLAGRSGRTACSA